MTGRINDDELREMALHRGLKLIQSRRRKPGVGDYGKFGLRDAAGNALLGIGKDGLTASAEDIESHLRSGTLNTWKQSAATAPGPRSARASPSRPQGEEELKPNPTLNDVAAHSTAIQPPASGTFADRKAVTPAQQTLEGKLSRKAKKLPEPSLTIRPGKISDVQFLENFLPSLAEAAVIGGRVTQLRRAGGGFLVAELGLTVGCCFWVPMPTMQHGLIGRLSLLWVAEDYRRRGIGTKLLLAAEQSLTGRGCSRIEVMSDIEIKNSHNFFRTLKFEQSSYRFVRDIASV
jgi:N-acetylglutamate synthase-like GNAT family acetyltransferase